MNRPTLLLAISALWFLSEILIGRLSRVKDSAGSQQDQKSLRLLWLTIIPAVSLGVIVGIRGIGYLPLLSPVAFPLGLALIAIGLIIRWTAVFTLRRYFTSNVAILPDHQLVTSGIYGVVRHPAYAGALLSFLGLGVVFANWLSTAIIFVPIFLAFHYRIQVEEAALRKAFGEAYQKYSQKVKRLIPGIY